MVHPSKLVHLANGGAFSDLTSFPRPQAQDRGVSLEFVKCWIAAVRSAGLDPGSAVHGRKARAPPRYHPANSHTLGTNTPAI